MNKFNHFVGIDISKKTFDAALISDGDTAALKHQAFAQNAKGFAEFLDWLSYSNCFRRSPHLYGAYRPLYLWAY